MKEMGLTSQFATVGKAESVFYLCLLVFVAVVIYSQVAQLTQ